MIRPTFVHLISARRYSSPSFPCTVPECSLFPFSCVVVSWARAPLLMPHCFSKWCAALLHSVFGACALLFPWAQFLLLLLQRFFLDGGVLDLVFAFCWFRSIGPAVPAAALFFEIVCCNIARPWCLRLVSVVPALPVFRSSMLLVVRAYDCMFHSVSPYMTTSTYDVPLRNASLVLCVFFFGCFSLVPITL